MEEHERQLPSPRSTASHKRPQEQKRKRSLSHDSCPGEHTPSKKPRVSPNSHGQAAEYPEVIEDSHDPVAHWAATTFWPEGYGEEVSRMNLTGSSKRRSSSMHHSDRLQRLAENGIHMRASALIQKSSKDLCSSFLAGNRTPTQFPCYPRERISDILERVQDLNEGRLQRDIMPWVVPSVENLFFSGQTTLDYIGEEIHADWTRCATMGSTRPRPDYTAGLLRSAFTSDEIWKLQNYASFEKPFMFTPNLCFPFLMCEAKTGQEGIDKADRQNIHSASIAVRAIIELYKTAFETSDPARVDELYGQVLAFSVSHNNRLVNLYGHYAVPGVNSCAPKFYRYDIAMFSLTMYDGADRYKAYNFIRNVYEKFAPEHRKRIKEAVALLSEPVERTGLQHAASDLAQGEMDYEQNSQDVGSQDDGVFQVPGEPASVSQRKEMVKIKEQIELERKRSREREEKMERQMEQQKQESKEREEKIERQMKEQMEQQKEQMKEQMERQKEQMERQMEQQLEQHREIISLLKQARN